MTLASNQSEYFSKVARAKELARKNKKPYFVIWDGPEYAVCSEVDLHTFYAGTHDNDILYCTEDG